MVDANLLLDLAVIREEVRGLADLGLDSALDGGFGGARVASALLVEVAAPLSLVGLLVGDHAVDVGLPLGGADGRRRARRRGLGDRGGRLSRSPCMFFDGVRRVRYAEGDKAEDAGEAEKRFGGHSISPKSLLFRYKRKWALRPFRATPPTCRPWKTVNPLLRAILMLAPMVIRFF